MSRCQAVPRSILGPDVVLRLGNSLNMLEMQSGTPRDARIFDKMGIINIITNTYSCSTNVVDIRKFNLLYWVPLREISTEQIHRD